MLEKIGRGGYETISKPSENVLYYLDIIKSKKDRINVAEIGIGIGATSVEIVKRLTNKDTFYFFSFENDVRELMDDFKHMRYVNCQLKPQGNSNRIFDSYNWSLAQLILERQKQNDNIELFDLIYLDGAHSFFHDGLACVLLKKLLKQDGILIFDDVFWTYGKSPTANPDVNNSVAQRYTNEQIKSEQVLMVLNIFMENDTNYERIGDIAWQTIYRKRG